MCKGPSEKDLLRRNWLHAATLDYGPNGEAGVPRWTARTVPADDSPTDLVQMQGPVDVYVPDYVPKLDLVYEVGCSIKCFCNIIQDAHLAAVPGAVYKNVYVQKTLIRCQHR